MKPTLQEICETVKQAEGIVNKTCCISVAVKGYGDEQYFMDKDTAREIAFCGNIKYYCPFQQQVANMEVYQCNPNTDNSSNHRKTKR